MLIIFTRYLLVIFIWVSSRSEVNGDIVPDIADFKLIVILSFHRKCYLGVEFQLGQARVWARRAVTSAVVDYPMSSRSECLTLKRR